MSEESDFEDINEERISLNVGDRVQVRGSQKYGIITKLDMGRRGMSCTVKLDHTDEEITRPYDRFWPTTVMVAPYNNQLTNDYRRQQAVPSTLRSDAESSTAVNNTDILLEDEYFANSNDSAIRKNSKKKRRKVTEDRHSESDDSDLSSSSDSSIEDNVDTAGTTDIGGVSWKEVTSIDTDTGLKCEDQPTSFYWTALNRDLGSGIDRTPLNYFALMFPPDSIATICRLTNDKMRANDILKNLSPSEFLKYLGIRLTFSLQPLPGGMNRGGFGTVDEEDGICLAGNYGARFGMSRDRFNEIESNLTFANPTPEDKREVTFYFQ